VKVLEKKTPSPSNQADAVVNQGQFIAGDPKKLKADAEREMVITGIGRVFNLSWTQKVRDEHTEKDRNEVARVLAQSAFKGVED